LNIVKQIRVNILAIISLVVALSTLSYNTYRNELTEDNRNIRHAGFELLMNLNKLQLLIDNTHYRPESVAENPIIGWSYVLYINNMSELISSDATEKSAILLEVWSTQWSVLRNSKVSNEKITDSLTSLRGSVMESMKRLE